MTQNETVWLKSPVSAKLEQLRGMPELNVESFQGRSKKVTLFRTHYVIGNEESCDLCLKDPFLSGRHAEIFMPGEGEGYFVKDLGSQNGVFLNGVRIMMAPLPARGSLRVGRSTLVWPVEEKLDDENGPIAADPAMREILRGLQKMADSRLSVLFLGETGTGKDVLARQVHEWSERKKGPFVPVNGALTDGNLAESALFGHKKGAYTGAEGARLGALRSAHGGTLFLDEVADIPSAAQAKLLRVLESQEVQALGSDQLEKADFRLIAATSQDLDGKVDEGLFRPDLYYRIAGHVVWVPPLRERPLDILAMAQRWLGEWGLALDGESEGKLLSYRWPGNVRELKSVLERAQVLARSEGTIYVCPRHILGLERAGSNGAHAKKVREKVCTLEQMERDTILASLERNGWSRSLAAEELAIARSTLHDKMKRFHIRDASVVR